MALLLSACGGSSVDGCDFRNEETPPRCQERQRNVPDPAGTISAAFKTTCETAQGTFLDAGCPVEGRVAGCEIGDGAESTIDWFYAPAVRADVVAECDDKPVVDP